MLVAVPPTTVPTKNTPEPASSVRSGPMRSLTIPASGMPTTLATEYAPAARA